jgi:hypothetical protein
MLMGCSAKPFRELLAKKIALRNARRNSSIYHLFTILLFKTQESA